MAASDKKDTVYVDVDDEITSIIEKVRGADGKIVALVLPKRAAVLQSVVNMKLLKRTAENAKKHLVLVTSEVGLLPLAGSVGLHVASTPTSKPVIPPAPGIPGDETEDADAPLAETTEESEDYDPTAAAAVPVGELAAKGPSKLNDAAIDEDIDMSDEGSDAADVGAVDADAKAKPKPNKKLKVPNFDSFRAKLFLGFGVLVLLIVGWIFAFVVLPKATVTVHTDTTSVTTNANLTIDAATKTLDIENKIAPAVVQAQQKSYSQQAPATGQQNNGTKATGSVKFTAKVCTPPIGVAPNDIPVGTGVSTGGKTYITQAAMTFSFTGFSSGGSCANYVSNTAATIAQSGGAAYNVTDATYTASGRSDVGGTGSAEGGTDNVIKVVSQSDIDGAKAKINTQDTVTLKDTLQSGLENKDVLPVPGSFVAGEPQITTSSKAGEAADTITVTEVITYTMLGVKQSDVKTLVEANVNKEVQKGKEVILDNGVAKAKLSSTNATATGATITLQTKSVVGPQIDTDQIKSQVLGKKTGNIKSLVSQTPGVTEVTVDYSPFWVSKVPMNPAKVTVVVNKSNTGNN